jgi:mannobiose 2-epimerase
MLVSNKISTYKSEQEAELKNILAYWMQYTVDKERGGFFGKIDAENIVTPDAPKGSVLNSRILWSFSAAYRHTGNNDYLQMADRAYDFIKAYFIDKEFGGVFWTVDYNGAPLDTKKQIYALAFCLYGLSEYFLATNREEVREISIELYNTIERYSHDKVQKGYTEALARDWQELADLRLSDKDANERKSMNTHLHVLEAYTNLYRIWPDEALKDNITELLELFLTSIIDGNHLVLFFDDAWNKKSVIRSYGHDIEAAWLLLEAAEVIKHAALIDAVKRRTQDLANGALEGVDDDGGMFYEAEHTDLIKEKHWWVQAEAMVGFLNNWQLTGEEKFFDHSINAWQYIKNNLLHPKGEWIWGIGSDGKPMAGEDKAGLWKCPYHNSRACLEIIKRLQK